MEEDEERRKRHRGSSPPLCCSCMEENVPYLVMVGCSNRHTICHVCARMLISAKVVMQKFPRHFPGKVSHVTELDCPLCREPINGITNMFVTEGLDASKTYECPYAELMEHKEHHALTLPELHRHIIRAHNQSVKCPNCLMWLGAEDNGGDDDKSMANLLQFHIMKQCQKVRCYGCDRTGSMINLYMHSSVGGGGDTGPPVCESAKDMFRLFGENLAEATFMFEGAEDLTILSSTMIQWTLQYLGQRFQPDVELNEREFQRLLWAFVPRMFCGLHASDSEASERHVRELLTLSDDEQPHYRAGAYEEWVLLRISAFAKQRGLRLDSVSTLPFFYRILVMSLSDVNRVKTSPLQLTVSEKQVMDQWLYFYRRLIPVAQGLV